MDNNKLADIVNQSGFPLQIGVANHVRDTTDKHGWKVLYTEHSWKNPTDGTEGFIDVVLEHRNSTSVMVIECKRVLESSWIFLNPSSSVSMRRHAKSWVTRYSDDCFKSFDWHDLTLEPSCPESQYCVIPGQDAKSKPMIERVGADMVSATEGLAWEEKDYVAQCQDGLRMYFSIIVTTADLKLCSFNPNDINLSDGKVSTPVFEDVPFVRFRKQLSTQPSHIPANIVDGLHSLGSAKEHTVFIVQSRALFDFLVSFEVDSKALRSFV